MTFHDFAGRARHIACAVLAVAAVVGAPAARAAGPVAVSSITLSAPGGIIGVPGAVSVMDGPFSGDGVKIAAGDGTTSIGDGYMLPGEYISFTGNAIAMRIAAGSQADNGDIVTGYLGQGADHAMYDFQGLSVGGLAVDSFSTVALGGTGSTPGIGSLVQLFGGNRLTVDLDTLVFDPASCGGSSNCYVEFRIDLQAATTAPVPEPGTIPLMLAGGALVAAVVRRQRRAA